ncbi:MAG: metallophosphoesterase [Fodinibius sp.]|nr:metallophosphoesterase [Fodinibius sp.]
MNSDATMFNLHGQRLWLLPEKAIYWQKRKIMLVADLHIGKSGHFRKHGIAVPDQVAQSNLDKLDTILDKRSPEHLVILGDLFHSDINSEWQRFIEWRKAHRQLEG